MANHKSAKTRINRNNKRSIINGARRSRVRTFVKKVNAVFYRKRFIWMRQPDFRIKINAKRFWKTTKKPPRPL